MILDDQETVERTNDNKVSQPDLRRRMSWPFQMFYAPDLLDGSLACDLGENIIMIIVFLFYYFFFHFFCFNENHQRIIEAIFMIAIEIITKTIS